MFSDQLVDF